MLDNNARTVYADIIDLPHHQSTTRKHMSLHDRAAQFASYKALSGYEDMITEESRTVDGEIELSENETDIINAVIRGISDKITNGGHPTVAVTYFEPDPYKSGGRYVTITGIVKRIDPVKKELILYGSDDIDDRRVSPVGISIERISALSVASPESI